MKKHQAIQKCCAYCEHLQFALPQKTEDGKKYPSPYLAFLDTLAELEGADLSCPYKKHIEPAGHCMHFRYDPLKHIPDGHAVRPTLDPEFVLED